MLVECWKCRYTGYKICHYFSIHDPVERVTDMLQPGLYEKVINTALNSELSEIDPFREECELIILSYYLLRRLVCWVEKIPRARWR